MTLDDPAPLGRAAALRKDFDDAFAHAHAAEAPRQLDLLVIEVAGHRYALYLADVAEVLADRTLVRVPSPRPDLLGLVGLRGVVTPVYDLSFTLGHGPASGPRWLAQVRARTPFALAFQHFERHLRVTETALATARGQSGSEAFVRASVRHEQYPLPVLDLPAIFESVTRPRVAPERAEERR
jgi:chemotaxis signal transduction protein